MTDSLQFTAVVTEAILFTHRTAKFIAYSSAAHIILLLSRMLCSLFDSGTQIVDSGSF